MNEKRVDLFLEGINRMFSGMRESEFWPARAPQLDSSYNDVFARDFYTAINSLRKEQSNAEIAEIFPPPQVIRSLLYNPLIIGMKVIRHYKQLSITTEDTINFIDHLFDLIKIKTNDDEFCTNKTNKIFSGKDINRILKDEIFFESNEEPTKNHLCFFNVNMQALIWSLCFDVYASYGMEIHGPYNTSLTYKPNTKMMIWDYFDFKKGIWKINPEFESVRVIMIFEDVNFEFDMANHFTSDRSLPENLISWCVLIDGQPVTIEQIMELNLIVIDLRKRQRDYVNSLKPEELIKKSAEINYYTLRRLWKATGKDWKFSMNEITHRITQSGMKYWLRFGAQTDPESSPYAKIFDPRIDYPL